MEIAVLALIFISVSVAAVRSSRKKRNPEPVALEKWSEKPKRPSADQIRTKASSWCGDIRQFLTNIYIAIPSESISQSVIRIQLLCGDELKDKLSAISKVYQRGLTESFVDSLDDDQFIELLQSIAQLSAIRDRVELIAESMIPLLKSWSSSSGHSFEKFKDELLAVACSLDTVQIQLLAIIATESTSKLDNDSNPAVSFISRVHRAATNVSNQSIRTAIMRLESAAEKGFDGLDDSQKNRIKSYYMPTLESALFYLSDYEQKGIASDKVVNLCMRSIQLVTDTFLSSGGSRSVLEEITLEAEVRAMENLAAMRGDTVQQKELSPSGEGRSVEI